MRKLSRTGSTGEAGFEVYFYDQLGGGLSDVPEEPLRSPELWTLPRWVDEVEQVRRALEIEPDDYKLNVIKGAVLLRVSERDPEKLDQATEILARIYDWRSPMRQ